METNDMQALWQQYDARLDALEPDPFIVRDTALDGVRTTLGRLTRTLRFEVIMNAIAIVFLGWFAADHVGRSAVFASAVVLDVYAIAIFASGIAQLVLVMKLDYVSPVLPIAQTLANLQLLRARATFGMLAFAPLMWLPLLVVGMQAIFGIDAAATFGTAFLTANFAFGIAVLVGVLVVAQRYGSRGGSSPAIRRALEALSGRDIRNASAYLTGLLPD